MGGSTVARDALQVFAGNASRDLAEQICANLGVSLGKANYCLKALIGKGLVKARNFKNSDHKRSYLYLLTPKGIAEKAALTRGFLARKRAEYAALHEEIAVLSREVGEDAGGDVGAR